MSDGRRPLRSRRGNASLVRIEKGVENICTATDGTSGLRESPVFEYERLSGESRRDFPLVLRRGPVTTAEPLFAPRIAEEHYDLVRVRYDGSVVVIRHQVRSRETRTRLRAVSEVSESAVGEDAAVGNYSNLPPTARCGATTTSGTGETTARSTNSGARRRRITTASGTARTTGELAAVRRVPRRSATWSDGPYEFRTSSHARSHAGVRSDA